MEAPNGYPLIKVVDGHYPGMKDIEGLSFRITVSITASDLSFEDSLKRDGDMDRLVACWNACYGEDTTFLEFMVQQGTTIRKRHDEALAEKEQYQRELCEMERQRDELLATISWIAEYIRSCPQELAEAKKWLLIADAAIAQATAPAATQPQPPKPNGCHNRAPLVTVCAPTCQYTFTDAGRADAGCVGCGERADGVKS